MSRVLIVDDDPIITKVVTACLQLDQHQVLTASDLRSGVALLEGERVDLILTDLFADTFSPDALAELTAFIQVAPTTRIGVTTAHQQAAACDPAEYGLAGILLKPFSVTDLRTFVQTILAAQPG